jgi:photosystem II stability/assembly factor-like uncharacterized protein
MMRSRLTAVLLVVFLAPLVHAQPADEPNKGGPKLFKNLKFRWIGPSAGGRVCRAAGVPGEPLVYYAATAGGGLWKTEDGGVNWKSLMDDQPTSTIGSLAIAPSDPNVLYVGSGEANIRGNVEVGNGIYKSTDAGKTWKHVWKQEGQIGTIIVHPTNPDIAFAAVLGHAFGPNPQRGVYRTVDGGKNWKQVLSKDADTGASDVCFDPRNPRILFAGLWQARRRPWEMTSGGPGSGLYTSRDGGDTWTQLVAPPPKGSADADKEPAKGTKRSPGLPEGIWGKIGLAVAPSDSRRVYALIEANKGGLFRSDDGAATWTQAYGGRAIQQRAWYYSCLTVDPSNADVVWFPQVPLLKTIDGGKTLARVKGPHHGDHHDVWIDPKNAKRMIDSNDGGVDISTNGGNSWYAPRLPISQFYHISVDSRRPYRISGTMQDLGTAQGPSNSLNFRGIRLTNWYPVGGGEAGHTSSDPFDPNVVYATEYGGFITHYDHRTKQARSIGVYPYNGSGHGAEALKFRFQWTAPVLASRHERRVLYHAANVLFRTDNAGRTWTQISKDLTRNDKSKQKWSGGPITGDNTGVEVYGTIFAIAESPKDKNTLWAGSDDGLVHVTRDGGKFWENVTPAIKGLPEWGTVRCIEVSPFDPATVYVVVDAHRLDDRKPYLFRTEDFGKTWESLTAKMPADGYLNVVREDPKKKGQLYVGTEHGIVYSTDAGATWQKLKMNLPTVSVTDLVVKDDDLVVATNGRSLWVFDDLTPLRETPPDLAQKYVYLFAPRPAVRYRYTHDLEGRTRFGTAPNPPAGVVIHYHLKSRPKDDITLTIRDEEGNVVRTLSSKKPPEVPKDEGLLDGDPPKPTILPTDPGLHRVLWDRRYDGPFWIRGARVDSGDVYLGPLANPGTYTLTLKVGGENYTVKAVVEPDPRLVRAYRARGAKPDQAQVDLREQLQLALRIRDDISRVTRTVERLQAVRKQLQDRDALLADEPKASQLIKQSKALLGKLDKLEEQLHNPKAKVSYDILAQKGGARLYSQLIWLFEQIKDGDGAPGEGIVDVHAEQTGMLKKYTAEWRALVKDDLASLNTLAKKLGIPGVIVPPAKKEAEGPPVIKTR